MEIADHAIVVGGIPLPSATPLFLALIGVHVLFGFACVVAGPVAMLSPKRPGRHPLAGTIYFWSTAGVFVTMAALSALRWVENYQLFMVGTLAFASAALARSAHRSCWSHWLAIHISGMGLSYVLLLTAFYVDNGKNLPFWNQLPPAAFWILPGVIGIPIIFWQLLRHPLMRRPGNAPVA